MIHLAIPDPRGTANDKARGDAGPTVGVHRFDDRRREKAMLGIKIGRVGTLDSFVFDVSGGDVGQAAADALTNYLNSQGWRASSIKNGVADSPDVMLTAEIVEMSVEARSTWFSTDMTSTIKIMVQGINRADSTTVRMILAGDGMRSVFWFDPDDAQTLINDVLKESFSKLVKGTRFEGNLLRLK